MKRISSNLGTGMDTRAFQRMIRNFEFLSVAFVVLIRIIKFPLHVLLAIAIRAVVFVIILSLCGLAAVLLFLRWLEGVGEAEQRPAA